MIMQKYTSKEIIPDSIEIHGTTIMRQTEVKLLSITIDQKLKFVKHIDNLCKNAARQINITYRCKGIFDLKEREIIFNTFVLAHFNYCPMVWYFCGKASTKKIELIQERALRFLLNDHELLEKCNYTTMLIRRIITIAMEVLKSLHDLHPNFMKEMFNMKELKYSLRDSNIIYQPKFEKVTYG